jgi:hypothetical protein
LLKRSGKMRIVIGIFIILHGLVHLWYVTLSQGWVKFQNDMGWTGESWLLTDLVGSNLNRWLATFLYSLATITFLLAGVGFLANQEWARVWIVVASVISVVTILVFWDGKLNMFVEKGGLGILISAGTLIAAVVYNFQTT